MNLNNSIYPKVLPLLKMLPQSQGGSRQKYFLLISGMALAALAALAYLFKRNDPAGHAPSRSLAALRPVSQSPVIRADPPQNAPPWVNLPSDLILVILSHIDPDDPSRIALRFTCKRFKQIVALDEVTKFDENFAAEKGYKDLLIWAASEGARLKDRICDFAAQGNQFQLLQLLHSKGFSVETSMSYAASTGNLEMLNWLKQQGAHIDGVTYYSAIQNGHFHVVTWAEPLFRFKGNIVQLGAAAERGNLDILQWAHKKGCYLHAEFIHRAARGGHQSVIDWLVENGCNKNLTDTLVCAAAARGGNLDILKWARAQGYVWDSRTCLEAARAGSIPVLEWARSEGCPWNARIALIAAAKGHLETLIWTITNQCPVSITLEKDELWKDFKFVCSDVAGIQLKDQDILSSLNYLDLSLAAASNGQVAVLEWLYNQPNVTITADALALAAFKGHLNVLRWAKGKNIPWDDRVYDYAVRQNHKRILIWGNKNRWPGF